MPRLLKKFALLSTLLAMMVSAPAVVATPVGDFFRRIGRSISHLGRSSSPPRDARKSKADAAANKASKKPEEARSTPTDATPAPTPVDIRPAARAAPDPKGRRDVPYGVAAPNQPGLVTSPYAPTQGFVDVRAFPSSTEVLDPFTGKIFLTP
jgi:hypothetical protein